MSEKEHEVIKHISNTASNPCQEKHSRQSADYSKRSKLIENLILVLKFINNHKMLILIFFLLLTPCVLALTPLARRDKNQSNEDDPIENESNCNDMLMLKQATHTEDQAEILPFTSASNLLSINSDFQTDHPVFDSRQAEINSLRKIIQEGLQTEINEESVDAAVRLLYEFKIHDQDIYATIILSNMVGITKNPEQRYQCQEFLEEINRDDFISANALFARLLFNTKILLHQITKNPKVISDGQFKEFFLDIIKDLIKTSDISLSKLADLLKKYDKNSELSLLTIEFLKHFYSLFENNKISGKNLKDIIFKDKLNELVISLIDEYADILLDKLEIYDQQLIFHYYNLWGINLNDSSRIDKLVQYLKRHIEKIEQKKITAYDEDYEFSLYLLAKIYHEKSDSESALLYAKKLFNLSNINTMYGHLGKVIFYKIVVSNRTLGEKSDSLALEYCIASIRELEILKDNLSRYFQSSDVSIQIDAINSDLNYFKNLINKLSTHLYINITYNYPNFNSKFDNSGRYIEPPDIRLHLEKGYSLFVEDESDIYSLPPNYLPFKTYPVLKLKGDSVYICYAYINEVGKYLKVKNLIRDNQVRVLPLSGLTKKIKVKAFLSPEGILYSSEKSINHINDFINLYNILDKYKYIFCIPMGLSFTYFLVLCTKPKSNHKQEQAKMRESLLNELKEIASVLTDNEWVITGEQAEIKLFPPKKSFITNKKVEIDICENTFIKRVYKDKFIELLKELCGENNFTYNNNHMVSVKLVDTSTLKNNMKKRFINFIVNHSNEHHKVAQKDLIKEAEEEKHNHEQYNRKKISEKISKLSDYHNEFDMSNLCSKIKEAITVCRNCIESQDLRTEFQGSEFKRLQEKIDNKLKHIQNNFEFLSTDEKYNNIVSIMNDIDKKIEELLNKQEVVDQHELEKKINECNDNVEKLKHLYDELNNKIKELPKLRDELKGLVSERNLKLSSSPRVKYQKNSETKRKIPLLPNKENNTNPIVYEEKYNQEILNLEEKTNALEKNCNVHTSGNIGNNQSLEWVGRKELLEEKLSTVSSRNNSTIEYISNQPKESNVDIYNSSIFFQPNKTHSFSINAITLKDKEIEELKAKLKNDRELQIVRDQLDVLYNLLTKVGDYFEGNTDAVKGVPHRPGHEDLYTLCERTLKEYKQDERYIKDANHLFELSIIFGIAYTIMKSALAASKVFGYYKQCAPGHYEKFKEILIEIRHFFVHKFSAYTQTDTIHDFIKYAENYKKILSSIINKLLEFGVYNEQEQTSFLKNLTALVGDNKLACSNETDAACVIKKIKLYLSIHAAISKVGENFIKVKGDNYITYPAYANAIEIYCIVQIGEAFSMLYKQFRNIWKKFTEQLNKEIEKYPEANKIEFLINAIVYHNGSEILTYSTIYQYLRNIVGHRFSNDNPSGSKSTYQLGDERYVDEDVDSITLKKLREITGIIVIHCLELFNSFIDELGNYNNNNTNVEVKANNITNKPF